MKKKLSFIILIVLFIICLFIYRGKNENKIIIGIVEPLEHKAMDEIVAGFSETLVQQFQKKFVIKVANAQNDANLQRSIFEKMKDAHYDIIVPIGTAPTQMAVSMIKNNPIVSLAAEFSEQDRKKLNPCNIAIVHDEIPPKKSLQFIHQAFPNIKNIAILHSSSEKVFPEVNETILAGKNLEITMTHFMASTLPELMAVTQALPSQTQGIFILKDHLIVSGIATIAEIAKQKNIPVLTSDEGSVEGGALFALGVKERQIGVEGAYLAEKILNGTPACALPIQEMTHLNVFVNKQTLESQKLSMESIQNAADKLNYKIVFTKPPKAEKK